MTNPNPCIYAMKRYVDKRRWLNLWTVLLWVFGVSVIAFCAITVMLFIRETWVPNALTAIGTIVNGAGIAWVVKQRKGAESEERIAFKTFSEECEGSKKVKNKSDIELLGKKVLSENELNAMAWRSLFGGPSVDQLFE